MSFTNPAFTIPRRTVEQPAGEAGLWEKMSPMLPKATASPDTPEFVDLENLPAVGTGPVVGANNLVKANPVPEIMLAAGFQTKVSTPHTVQRRLMHGMKIPSWDERDGDLVFFVFRDRDNPIAKNGSYPAGTVRVPRGAIFHSQSQGQGPPPHTIHWHGIEPTPLNDGVGHCSMEIGKYIYQWQPNFMGTYFYHCHRNTVQHFEFGLFGLMIFDAPDAFFSSIASTDDRGRVTLNDTPIGAGNDGLFRVSANLVAPAADFRPLFPGFVAGADTPSFGFVEDPHAFTVPYDVEALWVLDDRDSVWSDFAPSAFAFFPRNGNRPGFNDKFARGFFNDFNADYWFVTGVPVVPDSGVKGLGQTGTINPAAPPPIGGVGGIDINPGGVNPLGLIPPELNSGVSGTQIAVNAQVNQTILIRTLDAAYNNARITFPVDVVIIAFDGRALGVPPFGNYNNAFLLPAGTPYLICTARRFDALIRSATPVNSFATVEFIESQGATPVGNVPLGPVLQTARIPIVIT